MSIKQPPLWLVIKWPLAILSHTHTSYIFRNTLIKVDCPTKASRTLESESWSAQAKLQGRRKQSKTVQTINKKSASTFFFVCLFVYLFV